MSAHILRCPSCYSPLAVHIHLETGKEIVMYCCNSNCKINGHEHGAPGPNAQDSYKSFVERYKAWLVEREM